MLLQAVMFNAFGTIISASPIRPGSGAEEELWQMIVGGIGTAKD